MTQPTLYFDGCSKGNPGPAGSGALIKTDGIIWSGCEYVGTTTNNVAEYKGLILGLKQLKFLNINKVIVKGDSMLVINHMTGKYKVNAPHLIPRLNDLNLILNNNNEYLTNIMVDLARTTKNTNEKLKNMINC
jgi:ribonuclease HI